MLYKAAKFLLVCYVMMMFKPAVPLIADAIAHTFYEQQHIMMVHEVQGKFHIHQELGKAAHQSDSEKSNEQKMETEQYVHVSPSIFKVTLDAQCCGNYLSFSNEIPFSPFRSIHYPPPRQAAQDKISGAICHGKLFRALVSVC